MVGTTQSFALEVRTMIIHFISHNDVDTPKRVSLINGVSPTGSEGDSLFLVQCLSDIP